MLEVDGICGTGGWGVPDVYVGVPEILGVTLAGGGGGVYPAGVCAEGMEIEGC